MVLGVTVLLTGLLLPALSRVRENANKIVCASNMRQLYTGMVLYYDDYDRLPYSQAAHDPRPGRLSELQVSHQIIPTGPPVPGDWDGLGLLYAYGYCKCVKCFYCPSHTGKHSFEEFADAWLRPNFQLIYTNFHYAGDVAWDKAAHGKVRLERRRLEEGDRLILLTDGMRTTRDFNHRVGTNVLRGGGAVLWWADLTDRVVNDLPSGDMLDDDPEGYQLDQIYRDIWERISSDMN